MRTTVVRGAILGIGLGMATILLSALAATDALCQEPEPILIEIEKLHDGQIGGQVQVRVSIDNPDETREIGLVDLLIEYPVDSVMLATASQGQLLTDCGWVSFYWEVVATRFVHLTLIADEEGDSHAPDCFLEGMQGELAKLTFTVADDPSLDCRFLPLVFHWQECDDNYLLLNGDETHYVSNEVRDYEGLPMPDVDTLPNYCGVPDSCLDELPGPPPERLLDLQGGGVDILCADSIDMRGDLNLNNIPNEIADLVLFSSYFMYGLGVFTTNPDAQIAASDVNNDGLVLTYRDFVYLYRIITGDAFPYPRGSSSGEFLMAGFEQNLLDNTVEVFYADGGLAGAWLIFDDSVTATCAFPGPVFACMHHFDGDETNVLVLTERENEIYSGPLLTVEGPGILIEAQTADFYDSDISTAISVFSGDLGINFVVGLVGHVFSDSPLPEPAELADANCSGVVDIDDIVWVIEYIFMGGPAPGDC